MQLQISCELYSRMSAIPLLLDPEDRRKYLRSMYFERINKQLYAIVTNVKIAAIEYLGRDDGPDEHTAIIIDPVLIAQCEKEIVFNSSLHIVSNPALAFTAIKTTFGYNYPGNAATALPEENDFITWKKWFPENMPTETIGAMRWDVQQLHALGTASKSGIVSFPEFIDINFPVVINDAENSDWVGLFMANPLDKSHVPPATIPDWI